jgi:ketosteroid isomerase-like protein
MDRAIASVFALLLSLAGLQAPTGYDDTPLQPDGKWKVHDGRRPRPAVVTPGALVSIPPPSDAIVLLGPGSNLSSWSATDGSATTWPMADGVLQTGKGMLRTKAEFGDLQLHVEFATPSEVKGNSQDRGNSGVFLSGVFEIQVLDSFDNVSYADGQAAAMYGQHPPLVNASRKPGEWQSYDITFTAPRFNGDTLVAPARATVFHNGVLVHDARAFWGPTAHKRIDAYRPSNARGPVRLQDHGNPVRYRNIWVRELPAQAGGGEAEVIAAAESFYAAMKAGDTAAAMRVVAADAVFLEAGGLETRAEYEANHLPADMEFEKAVTGKRGPWRVVVQGDTAWLNAMTEYLGTFQGKPVNFVGAQLLVMSRTAGVWQIRAAHWSSRRR